MTANRSGAGPLTGPRPKADAAEPAPPKPFLPYGRQAIDEEDIACVSRVLRSEFLTTGAAVEAFEAAFRSAVGADHAISCANGTAALHLVNLALDVGPGDLCIVPAITFAATANSARMVGADVLFADVDPETGLMRPQDLDDAIARAKGGRIKLAAAVHLAGQAADMKALSAVARMHGFELVEDACHALGSRSQAGGSAVWTVGDCAWSKAAVFSFHPVKTIACGEGGMITTRDSDLARRLSLLRSHGIERDPANFLPRPLAFDAEGHPNPWYHEMVELGWNYRLSDIHSALGLSQLRKLSRFCRQRSALMERYEQRLACFAPELRMTRHTAKVEVGWHLCTVLIDFGAFGTDRAAVMKALADRGIGSQVHYIPLYRQPYYEGLYGQQRLPGAEAYYAKALSLPLYVGMTFSDVDRVVEDLTEILGVDHGA